MLVIGVLVVAGFGGLLGLYILHRFAATADRAPTRPLAAAELDGYFARGAGFAVTASALTELSRDAVFDRLDGPYLSTLPFLSGPHRCGDERGPAGRRWFSGTVFSVTEEVAVAGPGSVRAFSGVAVCLPWTIKDFAERFVVTEESSGLLRVEWTIAGTPRWVGRLPWRLLAPPARPVFAFVLRHVLRPPTFRRPRSGTS